MANLLYVQGNLLQKLRQHPSVRFWQPIIELFPKRNVALEERSFYERDLEIEEGYVYVTIDLNFVYCRNNMVSFLYEDQDLSYRFTVSKGVLRTVDGKQFNSLIGAIGKVISSTDVKMINMETVFHPLFDAVLFGENAPDLPPPEDVPDPSLPPATLPPPTAPKPRTPNRPPKPPAEVVAQYPKDLCEKIVHMKTISKKSYKYVAEKHNVPEEAVRQICAHYVNKQ